MGKLANCLTSLRYIRMCTWLQQIHQTMNPLPPELESKVMSRLRSFLNRSRNALLEVGFPNSYVILAYMTILRKSLGCFMGFHVPIMLSCQPPRKLHRKFRGWRD